MFRKRLLSSTRLPLSLLAILLMLCTAVLSGIANAQEEFETARCIVGNELPAELAELDLEGLQAALQERIDEDPDATVTLSYQGEEVVIVRADLLLADEAVLIALIEGGPLNVTYGTSPGDDGLYVVTDIEVSAEEDCRFFPGSCTVLELPSELADLDVAGLKAELRAQVAQDEDALVTLTYHDAEARVRAGLLLGLDDAVLAALVQGEPVSSVGSTITGLIIEITLPAAGDCEQDGGGEPKPGDQQDDQQGDDGQDDQQGEVKDDQQGGAKPTVPDNQQGGGGTVTKTFELTLNGDVPADQGFYVGFKPAGQEGPSFIRVFCGQLGSLGQEEDCEGNGTTYEVMYEFEPGTVVEFGFFRQSESGGVDNEGVDNEKFHSGVERLNADMTNTAFYTFGTGTGDDQQDDQQAGAGDDQDDQQTGAGDDQQDDDQQADSGGTVTKTFELTLNGDVPADRGFAVFYGTRDQFERSTFEDPLFTYILFCGQPEDVEFADTIVSEDDCVGGGNTYTADVELPQGTELYFSFVTAVETDLQNTADFFHGNATSFFQSGEITGEAEVLNTDFTNTAWYTFPGAGDDQQDDDQDDAQDDQQVEMPEALPETGAGGMAGGFPVSGAAALLTLLGAGAYGVTRQR